ncbi:MAG TPA: NAD(P)H-dependent oxidoreductase [Jatrophihabitans sp.]
MAENSALTPTVLVVSGSTRSMSTNTALCRTAALCAPESITIEPYLSLASLPHFNPDDDHDPLPPAVEVLRARIASAAAVLFCTPEYAGTLPGSFKNLLDWTVGGTVLTDKPVAWVGVAADRKRGEGAHDTLATVLGSVQARVIADACRRIPVARELVSPDGLIHDSDIRTEIELVVARLGQAALST